MTRYKLIGSILLILCLQTVRVLAQEVEPPIPPAPTGGNVILDTLNWLTPSQESEINAISQKLDQDGIAQIAIVTLNDCGEDKQKFRNDLFRTWGIGHANDNDGLLIMVCWYGGDKSRRTIEQETGYGLEGTLPDVLTGRVADEEFVPAFQSNQPGDGLVAMARRYNEILRKSIQPAVITPFNKNLAFLILGILATLPGLVLALTYSSILIITKRLENNEGTVTRSRGSAGGGVPAPLYRFALGEILALLPILGLLYLGLRGFYALGQSIRVYGLFMFPYLGAWLIILVLFYLSKFFQNKTNQDDWNDRDDWNSRNDRSRSNRDLLKDIFDIARDLPTFGGGKSGGGGSSKKF